MNSITPKFTVQSRALRSVTPKAPEAARPQASAESTDGAKKSQGLFGAMSSGALGTAYNAGDTMGRVVGGATSLAGAVGGAYLGSLGGAATMGAMGLGAGIPAGVLLGQGGLSVLGTAFSTGGAAMQLGILVGTACGAIGGYYLGEKLGYAGGFVPTAAIALPVGAANGVVEHYTGQTVQGPQIDTTHVEVRTRGKLEKTASSIVGGIGVLSGAAGGAMIGGVISSGAATVGGLIAKDIALSAIMTSGVTGAAIGGGIGAVLLGYGGFMLVKTIGDMAHNTARGIARGKESVELDMKAKEFDKRISGLEQANKNVADLQARAEKYFTDQFKQLNQAVSDEDKSAAERVAAQAQRETDMDATVKQRNLDMDKQQAAVEDKNKHTDEIAQQRSDKRLADLQQADETAYQQRKASLAAWDKQLDARQAEYDRKNRDMDQIVDQQSNARRDQSEAQLEAQYQQRKGGLDARESSLKDRQSQLDARKADLPNLIHKEGDRLLGIKEAELKQNLAGVQSGLQKDLDAHQAQLQTAYQAQSDQDDRELHAHESSLQSDYNTVKSNVDQLSSDVSTLQGQVVSLQSGIQQSQANARDARAQADSIVSNMGGERDALENEAQQARSDANSANSELSSARSQLSTAQSEAQSARADYEQSSQQYNDLQAQIQSLNNQLSNRV